MSEKIEGPFCYQNHWALETLSEFYEGSRRSRYGSAMSVYTVLTWTANLKGGQKARAGFSEPKKSLAKRCKVAVSTLDVYLSEFEKLGVLEIARKEENGVPLPNVYRLPDKPKVTRPVGGYPPAAGGRVPLPVGGLTRVREVVVEEEEKELGTTPNGVAPAVQRKRDLVFDSLAAACGIDTAILRKDHPEYDGDLGSEIGQSAKKIRRKCSTWDERDIVVQVAERAAHYRSRWPNAELTPRALAKHWTTMGKRTTMGKPQVRGGANGKLTPAQIANFDFDA